MTLKVEDIIFDINAVFCYTLVTLLHDGVTNLNLCLKAVMFSPFCYEIFNLIGILVLS